MGLGRKLKKVFNKATKAVTKPLDKLSRSATKRGIKAGASYGSNGGQVYVRNH